MPFSGPVVSLEREILKYAKMKSCYGLFCMTLFEHEENYLARVIQTGCLEGMMFQLLEFVFYIKLQSRISKHNLRTTLKSTSN